MTPDVLMQLMGILMQNMNQGQRYEVLGRITALVIADTSVTPVKTKESAPPTPVGNKSGNEAVSQVQPSGKVMIPKGFECTCDGCNLVVYRISTDVYENMAKKDFVAAFTPANGAPELKMPLDAWADSGVNLAIDCPLCKGDKSLWIKGKGDLPYRDTPQGDNGGRADSSSGASSV